MTTTSLYVVTSIPRVHVLAGVLTTMWQASDVDTPSYEQLFENNHQWVADELARDPEHFERLAVGQRPKYLFMGGSDSRMNANEMDGAGSGEMFIHRNIANLVVHTDMNLMSVLQFPVEVLEMEHVIVCGHYDCAGVAAAVDGSHRGRSTSGFARSRTSTGSTTRNSRPSTTPNFVSSDSSS